MSQDTNSGGPSPGAIAKIPLAPSMDPQSVNIKKRKKNVKKENKNLKGVIETGLVIIFV